MRKIVVTTILLTVFVFSGLSQISHGGQPLPFALTKSDSYRFFEDMPAFDVAEELRRDSLNESDLRSGYRFAYKFMTDFDRTNSGTSFLLADGTRVWRLGIRSEGALSINILFTEYELPEGARLFLYNSDQSHVLGAFNHLNNSSLGILPVAPVYGDELIIEYQEPAGVAFAGRLKVGEVNHGYRDFRGKEPQDTKSTFSCIPPSICYVNEEDGTDLLARSVVLLIVDGTTGCSGVLVNNTSGDEKPYLLTASHCLNEQFYLQDPDYAYMAGTVISFFNYESPLCNTALRGAEEMSMASTLFHAVNEEHDMALLELLQTPPDYYRPYYAGWNASDKVTPLYTNIHHPGSSVKRIGWFDGELQLTTYHTSAYPFAPDAHWLVSQWTEGCTAGGSSGSPLFDNQGRVIGGLSGGSSSCSRPVNDYFFALSQAWTADPAPDRQLKNWLDPRNTGRLECPGLDPYAHADVYRLSNVRASGSTDSVQVTTLSGSATIPLFGNNINGVTDYAEMYEVSQEATLYGAYFVSSASGNTAVMDVEVSVYTGSQKPETLLYTEKFTPTYGNMENGEAVDSEKPLNRKQESFIYFGENVKVSGRFFISYRIVSAPEKTYFTTYNLKTKDTPRNTTWVNSTLGWLEAPDSPSILFKTSLYVDPLVRYTWRVGNEAVTPVSPARISVNPDTKTLHIYLPDGVEEGTCQLFTADGKLIQYVRLHSAYTVLQMPAGSRGFHVAKVVCQGVAYTQKVLF